MLSEFKLAQKAIHPNLIALYEQHKRPIGELIDVDLHSFADKAKILFNSRLWDEVVDLDSRMAKRETPSSEQFNSMAQRIWTSVQQEIYSVDEPDRLCLRSIAKTLKSMSIGINPVDVGEGGSQAIAVIEISCESLGPVEIDWIAAAMVKMDGRLVRSDHVINMAVDLLLDSLEGAEDWLPPRIIMQAFSHARQYAEEHGQTFNVPFRVTWENLVSRIFG